MRLPLQMKKHIVQRQDLCTPAKVIKKNNLGGFSANPSKIAGLLIYCRLRLKGLVKKSSLSWHYQGLDSLCTCRFRSQVARVQDSENSSVKLLRARVSFETSNLSPLQLAKHAPPKAFCCISIIVICVLSNFPLLPPVPIRLVWPRQLLYFFY